MTWARLLRLVGLGRRAPASPTACPACGYEMTMVERTTFTGDDMRTYRCERCGGEHVLNFGTALWKTLSDAREQSERSDG